MSTLEASLKLEIAQYQAQLARAKGEAAKFKDALKRDSGGLGKAMFGGISNELRAMLPAVGAAAAVGGIKSLLNEFDDLADASSRLREMPETVQRVAHAANIAANVDLNGVVTGFLKLEKAMGDIDNQAGTQALERYGVTAEQLTRMTLDQKVLTIADAFQKARADGTGYNDLLALVGKVAGDLIPLFEQSRESLLGMFDGASVKANETVFALAAMNDQIDAFLSKQIGNVKEFVGTGLMMLDDILDPNKKLGDNMQSAKGEADKKQAEIAAAKEAAAANLAKLKSENDAKLAAAEQLKIKQQLKSLSDADAALSQKRLKDYIDILPPNLQLIELKRELNRLDEQSRIQGPGLEKERIQTENNILDIKRQIRTAEQQIADETKRAADEAKRQAEEAAGRKTALDDVMAELDILREQAAGHSKKAEAMRAQLEIAQQARQIAAQTGMSEQDALKAAEEMVRLKKQIAEDGDRKPGERKKIKGYSREEQGGADEARDRAGGRMDDARKRSRDAIDKGFSGLQGLDAMQGTPLRDTFKFPALDAMQKGSGAATPLAGQAKDNVVRLGQQGQPQAADPAMAGLGQQVITILQQMLPLMQ